VIEFIVNPETIRIINEVAASKIMSSFFLVILAVQ
jgi:hypothetical protein